MDTLVWTVAHRGRTARVDESGLMEGDDDLLTLLAERFREPVTVFRTGTVRPAPGSAAEPLILAPGDRRYVVARIRQLVASDEGFEVIDCSWR